MSDANKNRGSRSGFDRRAFLKGSGAAAAVTAVQASSVGAQESTDIGVERGWKKIELTVNDKSVTVNVEPRTTLLEVLRYQLDLTGAKPVSLDGSSGASTVLINGKPKVASTTLAISCRRKKIETVESLGGRTRTRLLRLSWQTMPCSAGFARPGLLSPCEHSSTRTRTPAKRKSGRD